MSVEGDQGPAVTRDADRAVANVREAEGAPEAVEDHSADDVLEVEDALEVEEVREVDDARGADAVLLADEGHVAEEGHIADEGQEVDDILGDDRLVTLRGRGGHAVADGTEDKIHLVEGRLYLSVCCFTMAFFGCRNSKRKSLSRSPELEVPYLYYEEKIALYIIFIQLVRLYYILPFSQYAFFSTDKFLDP